MTLAVRVTCSAAPRGSGFKWPPFQHTYKLTGTAPPFKRAGGRAGAVQITSGWFTHHL